MLSIHMNTYRSLLDQKRDLQYEYNLDSSMDIMEKLVDVSFAINQLKFTMAKEFHGPHFDELSERYKLANLKYTNVFKVGEDVNEKDLEESYQDRKKCWNDIFHFMTL